VSDPQFPISADSLCTSLKEYFLHQGDKTVHNVLLVSKAKFYVSGYDGWDGGTYLFTFLLEIPIKHYARIENNLEEIHKLLTDKSRSFLANTGNCSLSEVQIKPELIINPQAKPIINEDKISQTWKNENNLRVFLSHISKHKKSVSDLKDSLLDFGITAFVAHEDIEPSLEWQKQIEFALQTMHVFIPLLTPDFHSSFWTDQEVGFAYANRIPMTFPHYLVQSES
jgi:hypothetical protein